jgi:hypothetical protein
VQIFDQKKFKKRDQGFLGVVNVRIGNVMDLDAGGDGKLSLGPNDLFDIPPMLTYSSSNQQKCSPEI